MAYRFQDLQGNWRMRYDDGTVSPVIDPAQTPLNVNDLTSLKTVPRDISAEHRAKFGTDSEFISINNNLEGSTRMDELRHAIIEREMSDSRISTFQQEFQPLAEMASTQDALITEVAANPLADPEARAGAFQALYPGMKVDLDARGNLSFTAKNTDLGFQYPDRKKFREAQLKRENPDTPLDVVEETTSLSRILTDLQAADSPEMVTSLMEDAAAILSKVSTYKSNIYQSEVSHEFGVDSLQQQLAQARLWDEQERIREAGFGNMIAGDSPETKGIINSLAVARAGQQERVNSLLSEDVDLARMSTVYETIKSVAQHQLREALTVPELLPQDLVAAFNDIWNDDGSALTVKQQSELAKKLAANDQDMMLMAAAARGEAATALMASQVISPVHKSALERMFDSQYGETGVFDRMTNDIANFDAFMAERNIVLEPSEEAVLADLSSATFKAKSPTEQQEVRDRALDIKTQKVLEVYKEARDLSFMKNLFANNSRPADDMTGDYFESAAIAQKNREIKAAKEAAKSGRWTGPLAREKNLITQAEIAADPEKFYTLDMSTVISGMVSRMLGSGEFPDNDSQLEAVNQMINSMNDWLEPQASNAIGYRAFGRVSGTSKADLTRLFLNAYTSQKTTYQSVFIEPYMYPF